MENMFLFGVIVGIAVMGIFWILSAMAYQQTLLSCARSEIPEKLADGDFYYLVRDDAYNSLLLRKFEKV